MLIKIRISDKVGTIIIRLQNSYCSNRILFLLTLLVNVPYCFYLLKRSINVSI